MNRSIRFPDLGSPTFSLLGRRIAELATCELLLLANFPSWFPVLPLYFLSYFADNSFPPFKPFSPIVQRIRGAISRSFGLRSFRLGLSRVSDFIATWTASILLPPSS